jgi:hypothetical protein
LMVLFSQLSFFKKRLFLSFLKRLLLIIGLRDKRQSPGSFLLMKLGRLSKVGDMSRRMGRRKPWSSQEKTKPQIWIADPYFTTLVCNLEMHYK